MSEDIDLHDPYAANRAFHAYQEAVEAWARATVELEKAHDKMTKMADVLRKFMKVP